MSWDSEDSTNSYVASLETNLIPQYADVSNKKLKNEGGSFSKTCLKF